MESPAYDKKNHRFCAPSLLLRYSSSHRLPRLGGKSTPRRPPDPSLEGGSSLVASLEDRASETQEDEIVPTSASLRAAHGEQVLHAEKEAVSRSRVIRAQRRESARVEHVRIIRRVLRQGIRKRERLSVLLLTALAARIYGRNMDRDKLSCG